MAFSESLARKVREELLGERAVWVEKPMMGGLTFMVGDKMCVGVLGEELLLRIGPVHYQTALAQEGVRQMDITGKVFRGFVFAGPESYRKPGKLKDWVLLALQFNRELEQNPPAKTKARGPLKAEVDGKAGKDR